MSAIHRVSRTPRPTGHLIYSPNPQKTYIQLCKLRLVWNRVVCRRHHLDPQELQQYQCPTHTASILYPRRYHNSFEGPYPEPPSKSPSLHCSILHKPLHLKIVEKDWFWIQIPLSPETKSLNPCLVVQSLCQLANGRPIYYRYPRKTIN